VKPENVIQKFKNWRSDWNLFAKECLLVTLDPEQQAILASCQVNKMTSVMSGTARGKDFVAAIAGVCFLYLTPKWDKKGDLIENTKVAMTAPTDRQVGNIMFPEVSRVFKNVGFLPGRLTGYDIRTGNEEWFLTGFKADDKNTEAWAGFHAVNTMFIVTEASGMAELAFSAIEGNLQGNSRLLLVFNPNKKTGYAAQSQKSSRFHKFRLNSLNAQNVVEKKIVIPGQVDYEWVKDKVENWCTPIKEADIIIEENDFLWEGNYYRPNDEFRKKVLGLFPKVDADVLIPESWIELANARWKQQKSQKWTISKQLRLGVDVAGMGRDSSCNCHRYGNYVERFDLIQSAGVANHMQVAGLVGNILKVNTNDYTGTKAKAFIDTIGEGAGVYSRLIELNFSNAYSCKGSEAPEYKNKVLNDVTGQYTFLNMRAYMYWAVRDWLDPLNKTGAMLPPDDNLMQELTEPKWWFMSNGKIQIEAKDDIKVRLKRSPDKFDALANTFYPVPDFDKHKTKSNTGIRQLFK
jgi:hypothetical protein